MSPVGSNKRGTVLFVEPFFAALLQWKSFFLDQTSKIVLWSFQGAFVTIAKLMMQKKESKIPKDVTKLKEYQLLLFDDILFTHLTTNLILQNPGVVLAVFTYALR